MYSSGEWSSAPTGPRPSSVGQAGAGRPAAVRDAARGGLGDREAERVADRSGLARQGGDGRGALERRRRRAAPRRALNVTPRCGSQRSSCASAQSRSASCQARMSIVARASPGIELSTSPPCMRVTCSVRPVARAVERGDARQLARQREHGVAAVLGLGSGVRGAAARDDVEPAAALARRDDRAARAAALHAEARRRIPRAAPASRSARSAPPRRGRTRARGARTAARPRRAARAACAATAIPPFMSAVPGPSSRSPVAAQRPQRGRAEREDGVVVAEQRDARAARALEHGVHVKPRGRRDELGRQPVRRERSRDVACEQVELVDGAARRVLRDPAPDVGEDQLEVARPRRRARASRWRSRQAPRARGYRPWMRVGGQ